MPANMWFEFFGGLFSFKNPWCMEGKRDKKEWDLH